jgi:hypothetical protein
VELENQEIQELLDLVEQQVIKEVMEQMDLGVKQVIKEAQELLGVVDLREIQEQVEQEEQGEQDPLMLGEQEVVEVEEAVVEEKTDKILGELVVRGEVVVEVEEVEDLLGIVQ